jgi:hypothetical protein
LISRKSPEAFPEILGNRQSDFRNKSMLWSLSENVADICGLWKRQTFKHSKNNLFL